MNYKAMLKSNTVRVSVAAILTAAGGWMGGAVSPEVAMQSIFGALIAIFMRNGVEKSGPTEKADN
jgi:hypothetical protein